MNSSVSVRDPNRAHMQPATSKTKIGRFLSFNRQRLSFRDQILPPLAVKRRGKLNAKRRALAHQPSAPAGDALV